MLSTDPGVEAAVPVGSASPLAGPWEKLIDDDGTGAEEVSELWVLVGEALDWTEVGVLDRGCVVDENHTDIDIDIDGNDNVGRGGGGGGGGGGEGEGGGGGDGAGVLAPTNSQSP